MDQSRGHEDKFGVEIDIALAGGVQISEILGGDVRDGDVADIDFLAPDQVEEQVERPIVLFQMKLERRVH